MPTSGIFHAAETQHHRYGVPRCLLASVLWSYLVAGAKPFPELIGTACDVSLPLTPLIWAVCRPGEACPGGRATPYNAFLSGTHRARVCRIEILGQFRLERCFAVAHSLPSRTQETGSVQTKFLCQQLLPDKFCPRTNNWTFCEKRRSEKTLSHWNFECLSVHKKGTIRLKNHVKIRTPHALDHPPPFRGPPQPRAHLQESLESKHIFPKREPILLRKFPKKKTFHSHLTSQFPPQPRFQHYSIGNQSKISAIFRPSRSEIFLNRIFSA